MNNWKIQNAKLWQKVCIKYTSICNKWQYNSQFQCKSALCCFLFNILKIRKANYVRLNCSLIKIVSLLTQKTGSIKPMYTHKQVCVHIRCMWLFLSVSVWLMHDNITDSEQEEMQFSITFSLVSLKLPLFIVWFRCSHQLSHCLD